MAFSKTIQMYIFDGNPNGRIMCELSNWNGRVYKISRSEISEFAKRTDSETPEYIFYSVKMMKITILFILAKLKKCSLACANI